MISGQQSVHLEKSSEEHHFIFYGSYVFLLEKFNGEGDVFFVCKCQGLKMDYGGDAWMCY